jgi:hypothetical protein
MLEDCAPPHSSPPPQPTTPPSSPLPACARPSQSHHDPFRCSWRYTDFVNGGRPLDVFNAAAIPLAGAGRGPLPPAALSAAQLLAGLNGYLGAYFGANHLARAPGGGVENAGLSRPVVELLLGTDVLVPTVQVGDPAAQLVCCACCACCACCVCCACCACFDWLYLLGCICWLYLYLLGCICWVGCLFVCLFACLLVRLWVCLQAVWQVCVACSSLCVFIGGVGGG